MGRDVQRGKPPAGRKVQQAIAVRAGGAANCVEGTARSKWGKSSIRHSAAAATNCGWRGRGRAWPGQSLLQRITTALSPLPDYQGPPATAWVHPHVSARKLAAGGFTTASARSVAQRVGLDGRSGLTDKFCRWKGGWLEDATSKRVAASRVRGPLPRGRGRAASGRM